ncbi:MAG: ABC transporter substrate-binding protein [Peptococcaceae bacterium]|jgi:ABC-type transport system substrate-binding protein|nr:ABC transporter substrate-binding protein [Peptococcaceae bacterium]
MKKLKFILCPLLILLMAVSIAGCGGGSTPPSGGNTPPAGGNTPPAGSSTPPAGSSTPPAGGGSTPPEGGVASGDRVSYTIGVSDFLGRFIQGLTPTESWILCNAVYDQIVNVDPKTKEIFSDCLEDWYYEDEVTLVMKLRDNVYFSNGMHATAEDLLYSYTSNVDRGSTLVASFGPIIWDQCVARDEYTVQFKFERPFRVFLNTSVHLICKEWSESLADGWEDMAWYDPVGSGPYKVVSYISEDICVLKARDDYWNAAEVGPVYVDEWTVKFYKDASTMYMDLEVGNIVFAEAQVPDYSRYVRNGSHGDGYEVFKITTGVTQYFCFSFHDFPAWNDKRLREAVAHAVKWDELAIVAYDELNIPADSILAKASPYHISPGTYEYNPDLAKQLLAEAGYGPGSPLKLKTTLMDSLLYKALGESVQFQLGQVGIDVELEFLDIMSAIAVWNADGGTDFGFWWNIRGSAAFDLYDATPNATRESGSTYLRVPDPKFRDLWFTMVNNTDPNVYGPAIRELQQYTFDEIIYIPYYEFSAGMAYRTNIFTEEQLRDYIIGVNNYQIGRLGLRSAWK